MWRKNPYTASAHPDVLFTIVQKSVIRVIKTNASDASSSNCQLMIRGIEPHQQVDLCTNDCKNLTLIDTVVSRSTTNANVNAGPVPSVSTSSKYISYYTYIASLYDVIVDGEILWL